MKGKGILKEKLELNKKSKNGSKNKIYEFKIIKCGQKYEK